MSKEDLLQLAFPVIGTLIVYIGGRISNDLHRLTGSVESLNEKMAGIIVKIENHEKRLDRLEKGE